MASVGTIPAPHRGGLGDPGQRVLNGDADMSSIDPQSVQAFQAEIQGMFRSFINNYVDPTGLRHELLDQVQAHRDLSWPKGFYRRTLEGLCLNDGRVLSNLLAENSSSDLGKTRTGFIMFPISLEDVKSLNQTLMDWILEFPADVIVYADEDLKNLIESEILPSLNLSQPPFSGIRVAFYNHPEICALRDLDPTKLERLVAVRGTCIRTSPVIPEMQVAVFKCTAKTSRQFEFVPCNFEVSETILNGAVTEPVFCPQCQGRQTFVLLHEKCVFTSKQLMKIQESPDSIPEGETPQTMFVYLYDEMVDSGRPGDQVKVTGIFKATAVRKTARAKSLKAVFRTCIDVIHVCRDGSLSLETTEGDGDGDNEAVEESLMGAPARTFHPSFIARAKALAEQPNCHQLLIDSFAPSIWEHTDVKKGLLCQLFGGTSEWIESQGKKRLRSRGEIHVLLCGDPSTAKSQLLQYVHKISPRGVYAVGRGTSAAGLTATVARDPETKDFVLESGAVVLSDRGVCCIDEFDKMDDSTRAILHEVMEQQTVSLAKAGIVCSLNARTAILASANPIQSRYDVRKSVIENINLPSTLLSRFDLIYLILDAQNEGMDRRLAEHLCTLYTREGAVARAAPPLDKAFLTDYLSYARKSCNPRLSEAAIKELIETYTALRGRDSKGSLSATPRQLDSLVRLGKALARMQLRLQVDETHVKEAARLIRTATYQALTDPYTGRIDFEQLHVGASEAARVRQSLLADIILACLRENEDGTSRETLLGEVDKALAEGGKQTLQRKELERALEHFELIGLVGRLHGGNKYISITQNA